MDCGFKLEMANSLLKALTILYMLISSSLYLHGLSVLFIVSISFAGFFCSPNQGTRRMVIGP